MNHEEDLSELIAPYQSLEGDRASPPGQRHAHVATVVVDDPDMRAVVAAWSTGAHTWRRPRRREPQETGPAHWAWIWSGLKWDLPLLADVAGVGLEVARSKVRQASNLRIIYPDGTVNAWAMAAMESLLTTSGRGQRAQRKRAAQRSS